MRGSFLLFLTILLVTPALALAQHEPSSATQNSHRHIAQEQNISTLTGCLTGKPGQYEVVEQNGTRHLIFNPNVDLNSYVGHNVELTGIRDDSRDASASSDEGTAQGMRFFQVTQVGRDLGACK